MTLRLASAFSVNRNYQRAKRLDTDLVPSGLQGYKINETAWRILNAFSEDVSGSTQRAFTWTGPYGSGKSSLALLLSALLSPSESELRNTALEILGSEKANHFSKLLPVSQKGWLVIRIIGTRLEPTILIRSELEISWESRWGKSSLHELIETIGAKSPIKSLTLMIEAASEKATREGDGLLIIIDEMGKFLEFSAQENGDLFAFQEIAELISRSGNRSAFLGILHQSFDEYARKSSREARSEWSKIQGRFVDMPFSIAIEEIVTLISNTIEGPEKRKHKQLCKSVAKELVTGRLSQIKNLPEILIKCIPLHPVTTLLLGPISRRRFGQNERSVFSFLSSAESKSFSEFLETEISTSENTYTVSNLWDYLSLNYEPSILSSPDAPKWSEAAESISRVIRKDNVTEAHIKAIKTIAVLDLFGSQYGIGATDKLISLSLDAENAEINPILDDLKTWSAIIPRRHLGGWGIFSGSDIDIDYELQKSRAVVAGDFGQILNAFPHLSPIVAKRHYAKVGTLRIFERSIISYDELERVIEKNSNLSGRFLLVIGSDSASRLALLDQKALNHRDPTTLISSIPFEHPAIDLAINLAALNRLKAVLPELQGDPAARRELNAKITRSSNDLLDLLTATFAAVSWFWPHKHRDFNQPSLSEIASQICDQIFCETPKIVNELLNRDRPSSQANAAKRRLALAMIEAQDKNRLGIEGEPAEFGIYLSILRLSGIHREIDNIWAFRGPDNDGFKPIWLGAETFFRKRSNKTNLSEFYHYWHSAPFGLRNGVIPILALAFILANQKSLAIYLDNNFILQLDDLFIDRMLQAPDVVTIRWIEATDGSIETLNALAKFIVDQKMGVLGTTSLEVSKPLVRFVQKLPGFTRRTKLLSVHAASVRDVLISAHDPHALLLEDLPKALAPIGHIDRDPSLGKVNSIDLTLLEKIIGELEGKQGEMLKSFQNLLEEELNFSVNDKLSLDQIAGRARKVTKSTGVEHDLRLKRFSDILARIDPKLEWLHDICGIAAAKPIRDWSDPDRSRAFMELQNLLERFGQLEATLTAEEEKDGMINANALKVLTELDTPNLSHVQKRAILLLALKKLNSKL